MAKNFSQLRYLGMVSQPEYSEYGFRIETEDKNTRLLTLTIDNSVFRSKLLMIQEAPDARRIIPCKPLSATCSCHGSGSTASSAPSSSGAAMP